MFSELESQPEVGRMFMPDLSCVFSAISSSTLVSAAVALHESGGVSSASAEGQGGRKIGGRRRRSHLALHHLSSASMASVWVESTATGLSTQPAWSPALLSTATEAPGKLPSASRTPKEYTRQIPTPLTLVPQATDHEKPHRRLPHPL